MPESASPMRKTTSPTVPVKMKGRRRPQRVRVRSDSVPATGCQTTATTVPIPSSTLRAVPCLALPTISLTASGMISVPRLDQR